MNAIPRRRTLRRDDTGPAVRAAFAMLVCGAVGVAGALLAAPASAANGDRLATGATLSAGSTISSPDGQTILSLQTDGNLVLRNHGAATFQTHTTGTGTRLVEQTDGNVVLYSTADQPLWQTRTGGRGTGTLVVQNDGNVVNYVAGGGYDWQSATHDDTLWARATLTAGQSLRSRDGTQVLTMQADGNLVLSSNGTAVWATYKYGSGNHLDMQADGNAVVYSGAGTALWQTNTDGHGGARLQVQDDGNLVVYTASNDALWDRKSASAPPASTAGGVIGQAEMLRRAQSWIDEQVPYSQSDWWTDANGTYRQDCSGFVSMAWHLTSSLTTSTLDSVSHEIARADLQPGDALLRAGDHVALFLRWADSGHTAVVVQEESGAYAGEPAIQDTWSSSYAAGYTPVRYDNRA